MVFKTMSSLIETNRLQLRPCQVNDLAEIYALWRNDRIRYFLFDNRVISIDAARSFVTESLQNFQQYGYGIWLISARKDYRLVGFVGCLRSSETPSLIFGIHPDLWGYGYATEAAAAVLHSVSVDLAIPQIVADVDAPNAASICVLKKLGMKQIKQTATDETLLYFEYFYQPNRSRTDEGAN